MTPPRYVSALLLLAFPLALVSLRIMHECQDVLCSSPVVDEPAEEKEEKHVIGPLATIAEVDSSMNFLARVDTGAKTSSVHATAWTVLEGSSQMDANIGKTIRFLLDNKKGEATWLEKTIANVAHIQTSEGAETRYLVPLKIDHQGQENQVLVTLNDRSHMRYPMLLGRNFLSGKYIVDVEESDEAGSTFIANN